MGPHSHAKVLQLSGEVPNYPAVCGSSLRCQDWDFWQDSIDLSHFVQFLYPKISVGKIRAK